MLILKQVASTRCCAILKPEQITPERLALLQQLNRIAQDRGQKLSQMALQWVLRDPAVTSALIGASRISQIDEVLQWC